MRLSCIARSGLWVLGFVGLMIGADTRAIAGTTKAAGGADAVRDAGVANHASVAGDVRAAGAAVATRPAGDRRAAAAAATRDTGSSSRSATSASPRTRAPLRSGAVRRLETTHIAGEVPVPQVLFITARDQRRFMDFHHQRYLRTSRQLADATPIPSWMTVTRNARRETSP